MMRLVTLIQLSLNIIFWMHSIGTAHGNTLWPPWITLSGCFNYSSNNATSNISNNEPTKCFETCQGDQSIGLKNMLCICNPLYKSSDIHVNRRCNVSCPGKFEVYCGSEAAGTELMSVYTRDTPLTNGINESNRYGYGYVVISGGNPIVHSSDNSTSLQFGYLCYDDFVSLRASPCIFEKSTESPWADAINGCNGRSARLITASDVLKCPTGSAYDGTYWIGKYREKPDSTTSTAMTSTATTSTATTTASRSFTSLKPTPSFKTTTDSRSNHNLNTPVIEQTSKVSSSDGIDVVAVVGSIVGAVIIVAPLVVICRKKRILFFKSNKESLSTRPADVESRQEESNSETSEKKHTVNSEEAIRGIEANIDDPAKNAHHTGGPNIVPGPSSKLGEDNSELEKRRRKGTRTKLDKNDQKGGTSVNESMDANTENHGVYADILSLTTGYSFVKSEGKEKTINNSTQEMYAEPQQPLERNIATASGVRLSVENLPGPKDDNSDQSKEINNDHDSKRDRKKHKKRSKTPRDGGKFDMPPGKSKKTSRKKRRKSRVFPVSIKFDVPTDKVN